MENLQNTLKLSAVAVLAALLMSACSKTEEPPPLPPTTPKRVEQPQPASTTSTSTAVKPPTPAITPPKPTPPPTAAATNNDAVVAATDTAETKKKAAEIEAAYLATQDFTQRVQNIYNLSEIGTPAALLSLSRLFRAEKDPELRTEILDSLFDVDGHDESKAALLSAGAASMQPKEVRESAIDGLGDIDAKFSIPILQALASDPDEEVRELAKDALEQKQGEQALQK